MRTVYAIAHGKNVRYVGVSRNPRGRVPALRASKYPVGDWLRELHSRGERPNLLFIDSVPEELAFEREAYWIRHYYRSGHKLFNIREKIDGRKTSVVLKCGCDEFLSQISKEKGVELGEALELIIRHWYRRLGGRCSIMAIYNACLSKQKRAVVLTLTEETVRMIRTMKRFNQIGLNKSLTAAVLEVGIRREHRAKKKK